MTTRALRTALTHPALPLLKAVFLMLFVSTLVGAINLGGGFDMPERATDDELMAIRPTAVGSPAYLIAKHDCWTGEAPAEMRGVIPGHVVVFTATTTRFGGSRAVDMAFEQIFDGVEHRLTVHAFCK